MARHIHRVVHDSQHLDHVPISLTTDPKHHEMPAPASAAGDAEREQPAIDVVPRLRPDDGRTLGQVRECGDQDPA